MVRGIELGLLGALPLLSLLGGCGALSGSRHIGAVNDDFDGSRFCNPDGVGPLRWLQPRGQLTEQG